MTLFELAFAGVAYVSAAIAAGAVMTSASWRERAHYYRTRLEARQALCQDRRCELALDEANLSAGARGPIDFTFYQSRPAGGSQETSTPG